MVAALIWIKQALPALLNMLQMIVFYSQIKWVHIIAVICSGSLFLVRGLLKINQQKLANASTLRYLSYAVDTVLLTAALMLLTILPSAMFANGWLWVKLVLLISYIVLGHHALHGAKSIKVTAAYLLAAVTVFLFMLSIALTHHPAGVFARWVT
jgi:uncharacterized membrane protein SirB2